MSKIRSIVEKEITNNNLCLDNPKVKSLLSCCESLTNMEGFYVEAVNCKINNGDFVLMIGTYYAEIDNINHPIYNALNKADKIEMYSVDKYNPDGAMFVIKFIFENVWQEVQA
ncbi:MAG: hypothetical protein MJZ03_00470 [archaeon]|nr:hypothetical protein [archaeon]